MPILPLAHKAASQFSRRAKAAIQAAANPPKKEKKSGSKKKKTSQPRKKPALANLAFVDASELATLCCPACDHTHVRIAPYPHPTTSKFGTLLSAWCANCGFGWTPSIPFDLGDYYAKEYAVVNRRGDRGLSPEQYFAALSRPVDQVPGRYRNYATRARFQIDEIEKHTPSDYSILDFGSGPGYALYFSRAKVKHAVELDEQSRKYLDYQGVSRVSLESQKAETYDAVLSSHSLEHLEIQSLYPTLDHMWRVLRPGGILYVEVPVGLYSASHINKGQEPHTLFFSVGSLKRVIERAGFSAIRAYPRSQSRRAGLKTQLCDLELLEQPHGGSAVTVMARKVERHASLPAAVALTSLVAAPED